MRKDEDKESHLVPEQGFIFDNNIHAEFRVPSVMYKDYIAIC